MNDALVQSLKKDLRDTLQRAQILLHYVEKEQTHASYLKGRISRLRDRDWKYIGGGKYKRRPVGCECFRIAPELRKYDMCDKCAIRTGFDRTTAFMDK